MRAVHALLQKKEAALHAVVACLLASGTNFLAFIAFISTLNSFDHRPST
jgi:hypothetical protein